MKQWKIATNFILNVWHLSTLTWSISDVLFYIALDSILVWQYSLSADGYVTEDFADVGIARRVAIAYSYVLNYIAFHSIVYLKYLLHVGLINTNYVRLCTI